MGTEKVIIDAELKVALDSALRTAFKKERDKLLADNRVECSLSLEGLWMCETLYNYRRQDVGGFKKLLGEVIELELPMWELGGDSPDHRSGQCIGIQLRLKKDELLEAAVKLKDERYGLSPQAIQWFYDWFFHLKRQGLNFFYPREAGFHFTMDDCLKGYNEEQLCWVASTFCKNHFPQWVVKEITDSSIYFVGKKSAKETVEITNTEWSQLITHLNQVSAAEPAFLTEHVHTSLGLRLDETQILGGVTSDLRRRLYRASGADLHARIGAFIRTRFPGSILNGLSYDDEKAEFRGIYVLYTGKEKSDEMKTNTSNETAGGATAIMGDIPDKRAEKEIKKEETIEQRWDNKKQPWLEEELMVHLHRQGNKYPNKEGAEIFFPILQCCGRCCWCEEADKPPFSESEVKEAAENIVKNFFPGWMVSCVRYIQAGYLIQIADKTPSGDCVKKEEVMC